MASRRSVGPVNPGASVHRGHEGLPAIRLPEHLAGLLTEAAYAHPVRDIEVVETHISWVLLTGEFAYKIKRPVHYPFVDLRSQLRRAHFCEEELRLNRRFAPELYLDVCDIRVSDGVARVGGDGELIERCVRMRQFSRGDELDRLLEEQRIGPGDLETFGRELAAVHGRLPVADASQPWGRPGAIRGLVLRNHEECVSATAASGLGGEVATLRAPLEARLGASAADMSQRRDRGRVRECHGDLHIRNIVRWDSRLVAFDCIEFEPAFRWIDVAEEIALLLADLEARGFAQHGHAFLSGYLAASGDFHACRVLALYKAHRALVRAKVAALEFVGAAGKHAIAAIRDHHAALLRVAHEALAGRRASLILVSGLSGSGKTWLAQRIAPQLAAVHLRSDVERKRIAGVAELVDTQSALATGLYAADNTRSVYEHLARCARDVLAGGYSVIVDATFIARWQRAIFRQLMREMRVPLTMLVCEAPTAILEQRIARRQQAGSDASEADLAVLAWQLERQEPITPAESLDVHSIFTGDPDAVGDAVGLLRSRTPCG